MRGRNRQSAALLIALIGLILVGIDAHSSARPVAVDIIGVGLLVVGAAGFLLRPPQS
jgi:hypothetical protein